MITVNGLTKKYAHTTAVDQISFEVQRGQIVGFLGPNGAGKTTTMRMLTCFLTPTGGTATDDVTAWCLLAFVIGVARADVHS
jgi:ABC-2 type transport system ATP-binding protein